MIHSKGDKYILELTREELAYIYCLLAKSYPPVFMGDIPPKLYNKLYDRIRMRVSSSYNDEGWFKQFVEKLPIMGVII